MKHFLFLSPAYRRRFSAYIIMVLCLLCLTGCEQRELCYDHSHVSPVVLEFDWSLVPEAAPNTMVVWFFSTTTPERYRFELTGDGTSSRAGFDSRIMVRPGTYRVLCHNGTTDNNSEYGETFYDYCLLTYDDAVLAPLSRSTQAPLPDDADNQPVKAMASTVYAHTLDEIVTIEPKAASDKIIRFTPVEVTSVYDVIITGVENLTADIDASAAITGLAEAWNPATSAPGGTEVVIPFKLNHCGTDCLRGSLVTFGDNAPHNVFHRLRVYTSQQFYYDFDVTEPIHKAGNSKHIEIHLHGLKLPVVNQGGMTPGVDGWENAENIELIM